MLALLLLLRAAAATTDDVVVQRGAVDHATVAALAADIAGQPAAKGWMAVPGAVAALLGDAGAVEAPYRVAAGAVEAHRDTEDGAAVDGDVSVLYVGADAGATFVLVDAATGAETRVPVEAGTLIRWRNGRFSHRVDAEDQRRALLGPAAPRAGGGLRAVGNAQADDGLQCASGEFAITFEYRPSGAAWGSMNSYPDAEEMCLAPSCFVKTFQLTETIDEAAGLSFAVVDAGSPQSEASVRVYGDDEITWYFCIDSDGSVGRYPSAAPTASARPTPGPSAAPTTTAPSAPSVTPTTSAPSATPTTAAPTTAAPTVVSCASRVASGSCGGAQLLGYAFDDANACANRAAATKTCGAHLQYSPRVDEVGCWCCPEAFEPPGDASSEFALYEIRACDAPTAAPSDAPSFSPTPYPSPSCGFYATLFSATFLPSGAAWASARASVFYGTWVADRDAATNPLITTLAYPFPSDDEPPGDDGRPLKRGARVEARYAGADDLYFRGRVVAVSPAGDLFDVRYDHGETEACVHRSRLRRVSGFEAGAVVDYQAPEGSWRRCKVVKARGRRGSAAEKFGYPSSALFAAATASTVVGCAAQLAVKVAAVAYGRRDAVTVINLSSNACTMLYALLSVLRLARSRLYRRRGRKATAHDTGVEIWRLVEALVIEDDDDKKPAVRDAVELPAIEKKMLEDARDPFEEIEDAEAIRIDFEAESPAKHDLTCGCGPAAM